MTGAFLRTRSQKKHPSEPSYSTLSSEPSPLLSLYCLPFSSFVSSEILSAQAWQAQMSSPHWVEDIASLSEAYRIHWRQLRQSISAFL